MLFKPAPDSLFLTVCKGGKGRAMLGFNLIWAVWAFGDLMFNGSLPAGWWPVTLASFAAFLLLYVGANFRPLREILFYALALAALGALVMPINHSGGTCYAIFACAYLAFAGTTRRSAQLMALVVLCWGLEALLLGWPWQIIIWMGMICGGVGAGNLSMWINFRKNAELRLSHDEVRKLAATAERERIGRDLHDLLGHTLSLVAVKSELAGKLLDRDPQGARREIAEVERVAREALSQVRTAVTGIRAAALVSELASARLLLESSGVHFDYHGECSGLPTGIEACLGLTLREAVTNIQRHANASRAEVMVAHERNQAILRVRDDGRGGIGAHGNGLTGMRERVEALGGRLAIRSERGRGTELDIALPLPVAETVPARKPESPAPAIAATLKHA